MLALFLTLPLLLFVKSPKFAIWAVEKSDLAEMETYYWCNHFREIFNCIGIKYHLPSFIIYMDIRIHAIWSEKTDSN